MTVTVQQDVEAAFAAAQCVVRTHQRLVDFLRAGRTLSEIDSFVAATLHGLNCRSAFLGYRIQGLPPFQSHACLSVNDCIVHGTHDMTRAPLEPGDVISVDIGVKHRGFIGDAAWTYAIEAASDTARRLMACGRESLRRGVSAMQPGAQLIDWARAVQGYVEGACGYHLVRGLGGHGYGRTLHEPPFISNVVPTAFGEWTEAFRTYQPGMLIAVEPMIAVGTPNTRSEKRRWPIYTADGSLSVHYEADVFITEDGPRNLTEELDALPDVVG
jgi:methionyl aminopeptidase